MTPLDIARSYIARGFAPVPIPLGVKGPLIDGWQRLVITDANVTEYFDGAPKNIGVLMGLKSGGLADVDLDCSEARRLAPYFLPPTGAVFGRLGNPSSHHLYRVTDPEPITVIKHLDDEKAVIVELRLGAKEAAQTVFPGSQHPSGQMIEWVKDEEPSNIAFGKLERAVTWNAAAALLLRHWPSHKGGRHDLALCLGGFLARAGLVEEKVARLVEIVALEAGDEEVQDRRRAAVEAAAAHARGDRAYGLPKLREFLGDNVADTIAKIIKYRAAEPEAWREGSPRPASAHKKGITIICAADVEIRPKEWLWKGHLLRGAQELLSGVPGLGKSQVQISYIACTTTERPWPDGIPSGPPANVVMLTAEDTLDQEVVPRLIAAGANPKLVHIVKCIKTDRRERQFMLGEDLDQLEQIVAEIGNVGLITVDPITAYMGGKIDSHKTTEVRSQLGPLKDLAERINVAISTITHPPKISSARAIDNFIGSQAFIAAGRIGHVCIEETEEVEDEDSEKQGKKKRVKTGRVLFANAKNNPHTIMPTLAL